MSEMNNYKIDDEWENYEKIDQIFNFCTIERIGNNIIYNNLIMENLKMANNS